VSADSRRAGKLSTCAAAERKAEAALRALVDEARGAGMTWQEIADAIGVTRQSAHRRFARHEQHGQGDSVAGGAGARRD
jgi:predicted transcriptional regulator